MYSHAARALGQQRLLPRELDALRAVLGGSVSLGELLPADAQLRLLGGEGGSGKARPRRLRRVDALVGSALVKGLGALARLGFIPGLRS